MQDLYCCDRAYCQRQVALFSESHAFIFRLIMPVQKASLPLCHRVSMFYRLQLHLQIVPAKVHCLCNHISGNGEVDTALIKALPDVTQYIGLEPDTALGESLQKRVDNIGREGMKVSSLPS